MLLPDQPVIYEVNTAVWLTELSRAAGRTMTLADVPAAAWESVTPRGVDAVWLMGVWERSPAGLAVALTNAELMQSFHDALPDLTAADIIGSPYCVRAYVTEPRFGGPDGLAAARAALAERGVGLVLDYVPNHVAPDHQWTSRYPERFIQGSPDDAAADPAAWVTVGSTVLAHGRDPYFPPWPDVVQLNAFSPDMRAATVETLAAIADQCDAIRCDMAMLMMNSVFGKTWGGRAGTAPTDEFWPHVIGELRATSPQVRLLAEAYWDLEWELQQQGFDHCYDKRLYDRLLEGDPAPVRDHLRAEISYQSRLLRFLENHDEPRAAATFPRDAERAAAVAVATLPGATLWHEGQFDGRRVRPPVFLARRPDEPLDADLAGWYEHLVGVVADRAVRRGSWQLLDATGWPDNDSCRSLLAWAWSAAPDDHTGPRHVVVVNWSDQPAQGRIPLPWPGLRGGPRLMRDIVRGVDLERDGDELVSPGLYVALDPRGYHVLGID